jgi:hypothetical protein
MLEEKISRLELALKVQRETHSESALLKTEKEIGRQVAGKSAMPRTCQDARSADPSLSSGMYWIDPDGQGVGDAPIQVYCDMASGKKKRATTQFNRNRNFFIRLVLKKRFDFRFTRQRIAYGRGPLYRSWMLFKGSELQRN